MNVLLNAPKDAIANKPMFLLYFAAVFCPQTYLFLYVFFFYFFMHLCLIMQTRRLSINSCPIVINS